MWLDPFAHQPADHQPGSISGIRGQPVWTKTKAFLGSLEHGLGCSHLGLPTRRSGFDINDDRQLVIDQIIGAVSKGELRAPFAGPGGGRIGERGYLRL